MPFPNGTYVSQIQDPAVRAEFEQLYALFQGYLSNQHKDDGSHGVVTADGLTVNGIVTVNAQLTANAYLGGEVRSWTPVLTFGGGSTGITYSTQTGLYSKFMNVVVAELQIVLTSKGSSTGVAAIGGLPYTAHNNPSAIVDFAVGSASLSSTPYAAISGTSLFPVHIVAGARTQLTNSNFTGTDDLRIGIAYRV